MFWFIAIVAIVALLCGWAFLVIKAAKKQNLAWLEKTHEQKMEYYAQTGMVLLVWIFISVLSLHK